MKLLVYPIFYPITPKMAPVLLRTRERGLGDGADGVEDRRLKSTVVDGKKEKSWYEKTRWITKKRNPN